MAREEQEAAGAVQIGINSVNKASVRCGQAPSSRIALPR